MMKGRIEGWRKIKDKDSKFIHFFNNNSKTSVIVHHQIYDKEAWAYNKKSEWFFTVTRRGNTFIKRKFKTKASAMRSAKAYMRRHSE